MFDVHDKLIKLTRRMKGADRKKVRALADKVFEEFDSLRVQLDLECGACLTMYLHPWNQYGWKFEHNYRRDNPDHPRGAPEILCDWSCRLMYDNGTLRPNVDISMWIVIPERLGQVYAYGMDVSPGAKTFLEFGYELQPEGHFSLVTIQKGAGPKIKLADLVAGGGLVRPTEFPFPVPDRIERPRFPDGKVYGDYSVPFLYHWIVDDPHRDEIRNVEFPPTLRIPRPNVG
jgi:hypothetical protein